MRTPRARVAEILRAAIKAGELRRGLDVDLAIDLVVGSLLYRLVFARLMTGRGKGAADVVVEQAQ